MTDQSVYRVFGQGSARHIKAWRQAQGRPVTGIAELALIASPTAS